MPFTTRPVLLCAATLALLSGCTSARTPAAPALTQPVTAPGRVAGGTTAEEPTSRAAPPAPPPPPVTGDAGRPAPALEGDVTRRAAADYAPPWPGAAVGPQVPQPASAPVDYADPLAVARGYVAARLTYRFDDPAGYSAALTATAYTTAAFAARSQPDPTDLARLQTAQETSAVQVGVPALQDDAPDTASTCYVSVAFTVTSTYRGPGSGTPQPGVWTLRLVALTQGTWRVDGVPSTS